MGDGRYYTYSHFFSVIILTFLTIFIVASGMSSYYRNTNSKGSKYITVIFAQIAVVVVLRFVEEVIVSMQTAESLRYAQNVFLIMGLITFTYYLKMCVIPIYQQNQKKQDHHIFWNGVVFAIGLMLFIWGACNNWSLLIKEYTFQNIIYTKMYGLILCIIGVVLIANTFEIYKLKKTAYGAYKSRLLASIIFGMLAMPMLLYVISIIRKWTGIDYVEFLILFMFGLVVDFLTISFIPYAVTPIAFDKMKDMMIDYIFVTDENDNIVYKNENIQQQRYFSDTMSVNINNIEALFNGKVKQKYNQYGKPYFKVVNNQETCYFSYRIAALKRKNKIMGQIITISNITDLIELVNFLEEKKKKAEGINNRLIDYSEVVYHLEKEKEINALLEKIVNNQEESMYDIISAIDNIIEQRQDENFGKMVDHIIILIEQNLSQVRQAVTTYREHYEE